MSQNTHDSSSVPFGADRIIPTVVIYYPAGLGDTIANRLIRLIHPQLQIIAAWHHSTSSITFQLVLPFVTISYLKLISSSQSKQENKDKKIFLRHKVSSNNNR